MTTEPTGGAPMGDEQPLLIQKPELSALEAATEMLTQQVTALAGALQTIGQLQEDQRELQRQVTLVKEDVQENAVPKHAFDNAQRATIVARQRLQTRIRVFAIGTAVTALLVSIASGITAVYVAVHVTHSQRVAACQERNRQTKINAAKAKPFFEPFLAREKNNPKADPVMVSLITAIVTTPPTYTNCAQL